MLRYVFERPLLKTARPAEPFGRGGEVLRAHVFAFKEPGAANSLLTMTFAIQLFKKIDIGL